MASATGNALAQQAATLAKKPVEYAWKGTKNVVKGLASYTGGAIVETFKGVRKGFGKIKDIFKGPSPNLIAIRDKSKEAIKNVFQVGKSTVKGMGSVVKGTAGAIGDVFMAPINGLILKPGKEKIVIPLDKKLKEKTGISIFSKDKAKAA